MSYSTETGDGLVIVRFDRKPGVADIKAALSDPITQAFKHRLYDFSGGLDLSADDIRHLADVSAGQQITPEKLAAVVAGDDMAFGLSRMFEVYREDAGTQARAFRDEAEALAWLQSLD